MWPFGYRNRTKQEREGLHTKRMKKVISFLTDEPQKAREIARKCNISPSQVGQLLSEAYNLGLVELGPRFLHDAGGQYGRTYRRKRNDL